MTRTADHESLVRQLVPINRLPPENFETLFSVAEFQTAHAGQLIYLQGHQDNYVHYLIAGDVELLWNDRPVKTLKSKSKAARRPLDKPGRKRYTVRAVTNCTVLRFPREQYDLQLDEGNLRTGPRQVEVSEIAAEKSSNWMIKMLQSELFSGLPAINIQKIFGRMERIAMKADEVVVRQGDAGDYYYVIERGYCEVSRAIAGGKEIHLADLGAGEAFGEAAVIAGDTRNASVTMLCDGSLMRLSRDDFNELIRDPLVRGVSAKTAITAVEEGAYWLDIRYPEDYAERLLQHSSNIPFNVLRLQIGRLNRNKKYIVCSDHPSHSAVGAFLLIERGVAADYLDGTVKDLFAEHRSVFAAGNGIDPTEHPSVIAFPTATRGAPRQSNPITTKPIEDPAMDDHRPTRANLENTIDRIDRLYTQREWESETSERVPVDAYAHTVTGQHLADLIDEMHENHEQLPDPGTPASIFPPTSVTPPLSPEGLFDVAPDTTGLSDTRGTSVLLVDTRVPLPVSRDDILDSDDLDDGDLFVESEGISQIVQDFESRIRDFVESASYKRLADVEARYQVKMERVRKAAAEEVRKRQQVARQRYEEQYKKKEMQLRLHYKKLMALANKISEQKAQLQQAKVQFEEKLNAANAVYKQVEDMRRALREHITSIPRTSEQRETRQSA